jgi:di/tricarboxylate transporter
MKLIELNITSRQKNSGWQEINPWSISDKKLIIGDFYLSQQPWCFSSKVSNQWRLRKFGEKISISTVFVGNF